MAYIRNMITENPDSIIEFWFGNSDSPVEINNQKKSLWWSKSIEVDAEITRRFAALSKIIYDGIPDEWSDTPRSILAAIICLDQFPRNMYRGLSAAFSYDSRALKLAVQLVSSGRDRELSNMQRVFCYLPFEHSEDIVDQHKACELYENLREEVKNNSAEIGVWKIFDGSFRFAEKHLEIIERFGRFPHRNEILGRHSTEKEVEFLSQPGSSF